MRAPAVTPNKATAERLVAKRVVAIVAGTRTGLNITKRGVATINPTTETARVTPAKANKTAVTMTALTTWKTWKIGMRRESIFLDIDLDYNGWNLVWMGTIFYFILVKNFEGILGSNFLFEWLCFCDGREKEGFYEWLMRYLCTRTHSCFHAKLCE